MTSFEDKQIVQSETRLRKLFKVWGRTAQAAEEMEKKTGTLGPVEGLRPKLLRKLASWIDQLANLRKKELDIISEINAIEKKHNAMRQDKMLRRAGPKPQIKPDEPMPRPKEPKQRNRLLYWLLFFFLLESGKKKPEPPSNG